MLNSTEPAFPKSMPASPGKGITKLEYFTAAALTGLLASWAGAASDPDPIYLAEKAVTYATEVLNKLP